MYELICPACGHVEPSPFVRAGAVVRCASCNKAFQIEAKDFKRTVETNAGKTDEALVGEKIAAPFGLSDDRAGGAAGEGLIAAGPAQADATKPDPKRKGGAQPGRKSQRRQKAPPSEPAPVDAMAMAAHTRTAPAGEARQVAKLMRRKRKQTTMLLVSGAMSVALLGIAAIIWYSANTNPPVDPDGGGNPGGSAQVPDTTPGGGTDPGGADSPGNPGGQDPGGSAAASAGQDDPPVAAPTAVQPQRLAPTGWRRVDEAHDPAAHAGVATFSDEKFIPEPADHVRYEATVALAGGAPDAAAGAVAHLMLINEHGRVFARAQAPLALLTSRQRQPIRLLIPNDLIEEAETLHATVEVRQTLPNPVFLDNIRSVETIVRGERVVHITATNGPVRALRRAVFVLRAMDAQDRVLGRWRVDWQGAVEPADQFEFDAVLTDVGPLASALTHWDVIGAGEMSP